jgi:hypothetical protein
MACSGEQESGGIGSDDSSGVRSSTNIVIRMLRYTPFSRQETRKIGLRSVPRTIPHAPGALEGGVVREALLELAVSRHPTVRVMVDLADGKADDAQIADAGHA